MLENSIHIIHPYIQGNITPMKTSKAEGTSIGCQRGTLHQDSRAYNVDRVYKAHGDKHTGTHVRLSVFMCIPKGRHTLTRHTLQHHLST